MYFANSFYSLKYGTLSVEKLITLAHKYGLKTLALTDINNTTAAFNFYKLCKENNIKAVLGIEFRDKNYKHLYTGIAQNHDGLYELNKFLTEHQLNKTELPRRAIKFKDAFIIYPFSERINLGSLNKNEFIAVRENEINLLLNTDYQEYMKKFIAFHKITYVGNITYELHKHLRAIDLNTLLGKLTKNDLAPITDKLISFDNYKKAFSRFPQLIEQTQKLFDQTNFEYNIHIKKNKLSFTGDKKSDHKLLEKLSLDGFKYRYKPDNDEAKKRLEHELKIIKELKFDTYFLIAWDIVRYSLSRGFYHVGRGSGANSIVAYCLRITDVDPIKLNLYFERFLNKLRKSPPDFDIDFSWRERNEIIDYVFKRYGYEYTALLGTINQFSFNSIVRELSKVYGLPKEETDKFIDNPTDEANINETTQKILEIGKLMENFPNYRSIHAGGIIISEKPMNYYSALDMPPKGFPTMQIDMYIAEENGLDKIDILSQRGIGHINDSVKLIKKNHGIDIDIHNTNKINFDTKAIELLKSSKALGCFYIESPAMRGLLTKLRCDSYEILIAASSVIRPGVAKSGMMKEYIKRHHNPEKVKYLHPIFKEQLSETYGVMVYQEDVLKIIHHFAGLGLEEADILRRLMSGKFKDTDKIKDIESKFLNNCKTKGYSDDLTKEVWRQIVSFAGYSFSKAHSASYAVESFQSLYLKAHFPPEFMTAVINNFGGFYRTWVYFHEAKQLGAKIELPCVNNSEILTSLKRGKIFVGFTHISSLQTNLSEKIINYRNNYGEFTGFTDFMDRINPGLEQVKILIQIGAFRFTKKTKAALLWEVHRFKNTTSKHLTNNNLSLFETNYKEISLPDFNQQIISDAYDEIELIGFPVSITYFEMLKNKYEYKITAEELLNSTGKKVSFIGLFVARKYVFTKHSKIMNFGTFIDYNGDFFDTVHFPKSLEKYSFSGMGAYLIEGKVTNEFGFPSIDVDKMQKLDLLPDPRYV
ncbi:MAG: DNA polymerase III subunit alpha [Bacteroidales bacterium]|nr:DNA polymerase III subunit alpha [Bacteroidales bacterium]MBN2755967.1 DNA polymerase III subunit alpha [Bacteroidales bacterium]